MRAILSLFVLTLWTSFRKRAVPPGRSAWVVMFPAIISTLSPGIGAGTTWHVPGDVPTIQAAIDAAQPGDDVLIAAGTYLESSISMKGEVPVHSESGPQVTVVDAARNGTVFICSNLESSTTIEGLWIKNGFTGYSTHRGGGITCTAADLLVRNCWITDCYGFDFYDAGGIMAEDAALRVEGCRFENDYGGWGVTFRGDAAGIACTRTDLIVNDCQFLSCIGGLRAGAVEGTDSSIELRGCEISGCIGGSAAGVEGRGASSIRVEGCTLTGNGGFSAFLVVGGNIDIVDCLVADNTPDDYFATLVVGVGSLGASITGCTIARNGRNFAEDPIFSLDDPVAHLSLDRTIIAFNGGRVPCPTDQISFRCCDVEGNGADEICGDDLGGNFSADPLFCDASNGDYTLDANSPCLPGNHPDGVDCGLIGARGQGCGGTATRPTTWGRIKSSFR